MKLSLNWIRRYADLPENLDLATLAHELTMRTVEVEDAVHLAEDYTQVVVGHIREVQPHPQADLLKVCLVDVGTPSPATIVCGGSNVRVGMLVAAALPGAQVRWHGEGDKVAIKVSKLRGVQSEGMICAAAELMLDELFPSADEREIMDLSGFDAPAGTPLSQALGLDDIILEIDNKSLTNRPDLWCHYGIARELAAIYQVPLKPLPLFERPQGLEPVQVRIEDRERCRRYAAMQYEGLHNGPSPHWMRVDLWKVGIRPISSLVDITNHVMLAVGQPTHAFDRELVPDEIVVRTARPGEGLKLLDGKELRLDADDLMICDNQQPIALAGVMGGAQDSILPGTRRLLLEIANFEPKGVRRSATRHQVRSESANRNEKGLDTQRVDQAMAVAHQLITRLYPEARLSGFADNYPHATEPATVEVGLDWLGKRLGHGIGFEEARALLSPLGFETALAGQSIKVSVPSWRATGDVALKDDVLEEIARMMGYEQVAFIPPRVKLTRAVNQPAIALERRAREYLAFQGGLQEVYTYPWVNRDYLLAMGHEEAGCLQLAAPPAPDTACLRPSLLPGLLEAVVMNLRYHEQFGIFEAAQVFAPGSVPTSDPEERLPLQHSSLAAALVGREPRMLFRKMKGLLELLPRAVMSEDIRFAQQEQPAWADSKAWLNILCQGRVIGALGLLGSRAAHAADLRRAHLAMMELNLNQLPPLPSRSNTYHPLPHFPQVEQDFSVLLDEQVTWEQLSQALDKTVRGLEFMEEYRGKQVPGGKKSLMFRVRFGLDDATMTTRQIEEKVATIKKRLQKLGGELRM